MDHLLDSSSSPAEWASMLWREDRKQEVTRVSEERGGAQVDRWLTWTHPHCWHTGWPLSRLVAGLWCGSPVDYSLVESDLQHICDMNMLKSGPESLTRSSYLHIRDHSGRPRTSSWGWRDAPALVCCRSYRSKDSHRSRGRTSSAASVSALKLGNGHMLSHSQETGSELQWLTCSSV